jgi:hypothetical protein
VVKPASPSPVKLTRGNKVKSKGRVIGRDPWVSPKGRDYGDENVSDDDGRRAQLSGGKQARGR